MFQSSAPVKRFFCLSVCLSTPFLLSFCLNHVLLILTLTLILTLNPTLTACRVVFLTLVLSILSGLSCLRLV